MFFPLWGQTPVSRLFLSLRPSRSRSPLSSLAPSWWSPCPILRSALMMVSCGVLRVPSTFLWIGLVCRSRSPRRPSRRVFDGSIHPLRQGSFTVWWVPSEPMGFAVAPPVLPYTRLGQSPLSWGSGRCLLLFPARLSAGVPWRLFFVLCMSQPGLCFFRHMQCRVPGLPSGSLLALPGLCR